MALRGGGDRADLRPLEQTAERIGNHRGVAEDLNVDHPQPGFNYHHVRTGGGGKYVKRRKRMGYEVVTADHPEMQARAGDLDVGQSLDTTSSSRDTMLMRIPVHLHAERRAEIRKLNEAAIKGAETSFTSKGEQVKDRLGSSAPAEPLYYVDPRHDT